MQPHSDLPQAFADLGIETGFLKALAKMGFVKPSEIQTGMIPPALKGADILGQARTGTGKTAAFGLPILQQLDPEKRLQALCLAPTRELAVQVSGELKRLAANSDLHIVSVYGGQKVATQIHLLGRKHHFVVGTPGRVMDFMRRGVLRINDVQFAVLDEVDRMLDIGFRDDIKMILGAITAPHQTIFVSATISDEIKRLANRYMRSPVDVNVSQDKVTVDEVDQSYVSAESHDKYQVLRLLIKHEDPPICIVFTNTKAMARRITKRLHGAGINVEEIHGDLVQRKRERIMEQFRKHRIRVLVATDLASRGIDVSEISHIINYDIPPDPEVYVHRIGRTARMGARGTAITLVSAEQGKELTNIEMLINRQIPAREVPDFKRSPPRPTAESLEKPKPAPVSRFQASVSGTAEPDKLPPKTLGSRFRTSRRRRL